MEKQPLKLIWTEADFDVMGWHDSTIHGIAWSSETHELMLDVDYIFEWLKPAQPSGDYKFVLVPSTIVFKNVYDLNIELAVFEDITIEDLIRESDKQKHSWLWTIECNQGTISFKSDGYTQCFRREPSIEKIQKLSLSNRGGISFERLDVS